MGMTKVQVISYALTRLGSNEITSLSNPAPITSAAISSYNILLPHLLSTGFWRNTTTTAALVLSAIQPVAPMSSYWQYSYDLPADYLKLVRLYPQNWLFELYNDRVMYSNYGNPQWIEYQFLPVDGVPLPVASATTSLMTVTAVYVAGSEGEIFPVIFAFTSTVPTTSPQIVAGTIYYAKIVTVNLTNITIRLYPNPTYAIANEGAFTFSAGAYTGVTLCQPYQLPPYFDMYLAYRIAKDLALSSAQNVQFSAQLAQEMAVLEGQALAADAQNRPQTPMRSQPIISTRNTAPFIMPAG